MNLLNFLGDKKNREGLADLLISSKERCPQTDLFGREGEWKNLNEILDQIFYLASNKKPLYRRWSEKIDDKVRILSVPQEPLTKLIKSYLLPLVKSARAHERCHGGEEGWSPISSLATHLPFVSVLSFDLKSAFESFPPEEIYGFFMNFFSGSEYQEDNYRFLTLVSTVKYSHGRGLPVGSPLSMSLFNRAIRSLDENLDRSSLERGFRYTRWVDDITISSPGREEIERFLGAIDITLRNHPVSEGKIFFQNNERDAYLLGQRITPNGRVYKNTREEREKNKIPSLDFRKFFGDTATRKYDSWA